MSKLKNWEILGIKDLFHEQPFKEVAIAVAKIVSKNMLTPQTHSGEVRFEFRLSF